MLYGQYLRGLDGRRTSTYSNERMKEEKFTEIGLSSGGRD